MMRSKRRGCASVGKGIVAKNYRGCGIVALTCGKKSSGAFCLVQAGSIRSCFCCTRVSVGKDGLVLELDML